MDSEDRNNDKKIMLIPPNTGGRLAEPVSVDQIKTVFITEGIGAKEIAMRYSLSLESVKRVISENNLEQVRNDTIRKGLAEIQNVQLNQAKKLMDLEGNFKRMRIIQLEKILEDYMAYYARHGHFNKTHPLTGEVLKDSAGFPLQINIPSITKEIMSLKETVTLSEGLKVLLNQIDAIINKPKHVDNVGEDVIDVLEYSDLFKKRDESED